MFKKFFNAVLIVLFALIGCKNQESKVIKTFNNINEINESRSLYPIEVNNVMESGQIGNEVIWGHYPSLNEIKCENKRIVLSVAVKDGKFHVLEEEFVDKNYTDFAVDIVENIEVDFINDTRCSIN